MKRTILALMVMVCSGVAAQPQPQAGRYVATQADPRVSLLFKRWAAIDGHALQWEAVGDFPVQDPAGLNAQAHLATASSLEDAVERVMTLAHETKPEAPLLFACSYHGQGNVTVVIRETGQPGCEKSNPL
jgi:hypothetical protein